MPGRGFIRVGEGNAMNDDRYIMYIVRCTYYDVQVTDCTVQLKIDFA